MLIRLEGPPGTSNQLMTEQRHPAEPYPERPARRGDGGAHVGRAVTGDRVVNVNSSDVWVSVKPDVEYEDTIELIQQAAVSVPGVSAQVTPYTAQKLRDVGALNRGANQVTSDGLDLADRVEHPDRCPTVRTGSEDPRPAG